MGLALAAHPRIDVHVHIDERGASFMALGAALSRGVPSVALCTSGTAAAEFHAAVIEAHQGETPMLVCTADRPPELRDTSAPQTIDQVRLFGPAVRWFHDPGVPDAAVAGSWRALAARAFVEATGPRPGPVHLNLSFRDPLVGEAGALPSGRDADEPWVAADVAGVTLPPGLLALTEEPRGVIVAGRGAGDAESVHALADVFGWPVLADPVSGCRLPRRTTIAAFDSLLRHAEFAVDHRPRVVLRLGAPPASKVLAEWLKSSGAVQIGVHATSAWIDPDHTLAHRILADPGAICHLLAGSVHDRVATPWLTRWHRADSTAQQALDKVLSSHERLTEPGVARIVVAALVDDAHLHVSSSMPIRDVEWFAAPRDHLRVTANRGANGIDGVTSAAVGIALARRGQPTALLTGDIAFLHDSSALVGLRRRAVDLAIVVIDNDGGGIFSFLPQASAVPEAEFELLFGTPHGVDIGAVARAHDLEFVEVDTPGALSSAVAKPGTHVVRVRTDRTLSVAVHEALHQAVGTALESVR
jgi:2-succinyl-5-enolpyruvyl-6-hydroxy-3-cyclohexene-1-carboxylate synthase